MSSVKWRPFCLGLNVLTEVFPFEVTLPLIKTNSSGMPFLAATKQL